MSHKIRHSQNHCTTAHIKSSNHTLSLHRSTSNSNLQACCLLACLLATSHSSSFGILLAYVDAAWTRLTEITCHVTATQPVHWRAGCCLQKTRHVDSYPLLWWRHCTCAEVCLPSRCLETDCINPLFYCWVLDRVSAAVAWQWVDQSYNIIGNF
jgi:hypothetical protein